MAESKTINMKDIVDVILETQSDKSLQNILIHKSMCRNNELGAIFFAMSGNPPKGYAMFLMDSGSTGNLHVFDAFGIKRKILSNVMILGLERYGETDVYQASEALREEGEVTSVALTK